MENCPHPVERYPRDKWADDYTVSDHIPDIVNVFSTAEFICAGEQVAWRSFTGMRIQFNNVAR